MVGERKIRKVSRKGNSEREVSTNYNHSTQIVSSNPRLFHKRLYSKLTEGKKNQITLFGSTARK
jgi:hypothetical protein